MFILHFATVNDNTSQAKKYYDNFVRCVPNISTFRCKKGSSNTSKLYTSIALTSSVDSICFSKHPIDSNNAIPKQQHSTLR